MPDDWKEKKTEPVKVKDPLPPGSADIIRMNGKYGLGLVEYHRPLIMAATT